MSNEDLPSRLPDALPEDGTARSYFWHGGWFRLKNPELGVWQIRDADKTTLGWLRRMQDGSFHLDGHAQMGVPNMDHFDWRPIAAFASVTWFVL